MDIKRFVLFILIGFTLFSCQSQFDLKSDKYLNSIFSENEVKEIEKIINYVDNRAIELTGNRDVEKAYHELLDKILQSQHNATLFIPFEDEEKYLFLESIDSLLFNEIWLIDNHVRQALYKDSVYYNLDNYKHLELRISSKYIDYLGKIGEEDEGFKLVKNNIEMAGGLSPAIMVSFLKKHNERNFTIPKNRLWVAVFLLSMEESHEQKMERCLNYKPF